MNVHLSVVESLKMEDVIMEYRCEDRNKVGGLRCDIGAVSLDVLY
jgi:hypothetical protein